MNPTTTFHFHHHRIAYTLNVTGSASLHIDGVKVAECLPVASSLGPSSSSCAPSSKSLVASLPEGWAWDLTTTHGA